MRFAPDEIPHLKADDLVWRESEGELVVLELTTTTYLSLNGTARQLWLGLVAGLTLNELIESLAQENHISIERARVDTESFLSTLAERDLVDHCP